MKILALDTATCTGWAIYDDGKYVESGTMSFKKKRGESNGLLFLKFRSWLEGFITTVEPDLVAYEQAHFRGGAATEICVGLQTRVQEVAEYHKVHYWPATTKKVKMALLGKGSGSKDDMVAAAQALVGKDMETDDEADAIAIALAAIAEFSFW